MTCDFTFRHYEEIISNALEAGYSFHTFSEFLQKMPSGKSMLLRHDIDDHFYRTPQFAAVEGKHGVKATYFFRVHAPYNVFEYNNYSIIASLMRAGHEIALHSEIGDFEKMNEGIDYTSLLLREKQFLEACIGRKVNGFSTHRDFNYVTNSLELIEKIDWKSLGFAWQAYQKEFHDGAKYVSEKVSGHIGWHEKCPCEFINKEPVICLLTHPAWWYEKHPREGEVV